MFKEKEFHFKGKKTKHKETHLKFDFEFNTQVIVCGSLASYFFSGINNGNIEYNEEEKFPAFLYTAHGNESIDLEIDLTTSVEYIEKLQKKENKINFVHNDDNFQLNPHTSQCSITKYKSTKANFNSEENTWVIIAGRNDEENTALQTELTKLVKHRRYKVMILGLPSVNEENHKEWHFGYGYSLPFSHIVHNSIRLATDIKEQATKFKEDYLDKDLKNYFKQQVDALTDALKTSAYEEIQSDLHNEANTSFEKENCRLM